MKPNTDMQPYTFSGLCGVPTKAGAPCQHRIVYANGRCKQHGGSSTLFMLALRERLAEKDRRRIERWRRKMKRLGIELPRKDETHG